MGIVKMSETDKDTKKFQIQCMLNDKGAAGLLIHLITNKKTVDMFEASVGFGVALLDGGNAEVQVCLVWCSA